MKLSIEMTLHGVLHAGKWTTEPESAHDQEWWRNGVIVALSVSSKLPWDNANNRLWDNYYQGFTNDRLIAQAAVVIFLSQAAGYSIDMLKTKTDDDQRNDLIIWNGANTGFPGSIQWGLSNRQLVRLALAEYNARP